MILPDDSIGTIGRWVCKRTGGTYEPSLSFSLGNVINGRLVGAVLYDHYNSSSIAMHCAGEGRWITRDFLHAAFGYPFDFLKVKKVIGFVDSSNLKARRLDEHLGFVLEATLKDAAPNGDMLLYSMTREQCRFLREPYGRKIIEASRAA